jgi:hypothetical protein
VHFFYNRFVCQMVVVGAFHIATLRQCLHRMALQLFSHLPLQSVAGSFQTINRTVVSRVDWPILEGWSRACPLRVLPVFFFTFVSVITLAQTGAISDLQIATYKGTTGWFPTGAFGACREQEVFLPLHAKDLQ